MNKKHTTDEILPEIQGIFKIVLHEGMYHLVGIKTGNSYFHRETHLEVLEVLNKPCPIDGYKSELDFFKQGEESMIERNQSIRDGIAFYSVIK